MLGSDYILGLHSFGKEKPHKLSHGIEQND